MFDRCTRRAGHARALNGPMKRENDKRFRNGADRGRERETINAFYLREKKEGRLLIRRLAERANETSDCNPLKGFFFFHVEEINPKETLGDPKYRAPAVQQLITGRIRRSAKNEDGWTTSKEIIFAVFLSLSLSPTIHPLAIFFSMSWNPKQILFYAPKHPRQHGSFFLPEKEMRTTRKKFARTHECVREKNMICRTQKERN